VTRDPRRVIPAIGILLWMASGPLDARGQCVDFSGDPAGCQPSTFDTPIGQMPSVRVNAGQFVILLGV
jgi:hypothetical protein